VIRRLAVAAALGTTALAFAADDPNAPLANTKAQLQTLKKDAAAQNADAPAGPKLNLPSLTAPGPELDIQRPGRDGGEAKEKRRAEKKDWLLEGFDSLDRKRSSDAAKRVSGQSEDDEKPLDPNDPDYFLRLYERQRAQRDAQQIDVNGSPTNEFRADTGDAFAPFMKEWLANSPVRDVIKDTMTDTARADPVLPQATTSALPHEARSGALPSESVGNSGAPNPFVQALGLPALESSRPAVVSGSVGNGVRDLTPPAPPAPANTIYDLPARSKADVKRALPPPPSEDKKYFPQLKKF
jgi:hypothetical protein